MSLDKNVIAHFSVKSQAKLCFMFRLFFVRRRLAVMGNRRFAVFGRFVGFKGKGKEEASVKRSLWGVMVVCFGE